MTPTPIAPPRARRQRIEAKFVSKDFALDMCIAEMEKVRRVAPTLIAENVIAIARRARWNITK